MVRITEVQRPPRDAVKRQDELVRAPVLLPVLIDPLRQCADIARIVVIGILRIARVAEKTASSAEAVVLDAYCG
jgi:hypothetical protein